MGSYPISKFRHPTSVCFFPSLLRVISHSTIITILPSSLLSNFLSRSHLLPLPHRSKQKKITPTDINNSTYIGFARYTLFNGCRLCSANICKPLFGVEFAWQRGTFSGAKRHLFHFICEKQIWRSCLVTFFIKNFRNPAANFAEPNPILHDSARIMWHTSKQRKTRDESCFGGRMKLTWNLLVASENICFVRHHEQYEIEDCLRRGICSNSNCLG